MSWVTTAASARAIQRSSHQVLTRKSQDSDDQIKSKEERSGWKCTGCHATNCAHESQCSWCRTYRLEEKPEPSIERQWDETEMAMRKAAREALRKNDPSVYTAHPKRRTKEMSIGAKVFIGCMVTILGMIWLDPFVPSNVHSAVYNTGLLAILVALFTSVTWFFKDEE